MMHDVFLNTLWSTGTYILGLLALVATRFAFVYMRGSPRPKIILPKNSTTTRTAVIAPINRGVDIDRHMDELEDALLAPPVPTVQVEPVAPVKVQPVAPVKVQPVAPVKVQPVKSREVKPTKEIVVEAPIIECAKCGKQIKSPPIQKGGDAQYKCEHCGTVVALA